MIAAYGINEKFHLLEKIVERFVTTHLPLYEAYPHGGLRRYIFFGRLLIVDVVPLEQTGEVFRLLVVGQIVSHYLTDVEIVGELEQ